MLLREDLCPPVHYHPLPWTEAALPQGLTPVHQLECGFCRCERLAQRRQYNTYFTCLSPYRKWRLGEFCCFPCLSTMFLILEEMKRQVRLTFIWCLKYAIYYSNWSRFWHISFSLPYCKYWDTERFGTQSGSHQDSSLVVSLWIPLSYQ